MFAVIKEVKAPIVMFDATCEVLGIHSGGPGEKGAVFEWAYESEDGFRVYSVFDTEDNAKANIEATVEAAQQVAAKFGFPIDPSAVMMTIHPVHAYFTANPA